LFTGTDRDSNTTPLVVGHLLLYLAIWISAKTDGPSQMLTAMPYARLAAPAASGEYRFMFEKVLLM